MIPQISDFAGFESNVKQGMTLTTVIRCRGRSMFESNVKQGMTLTLIPPKCRVFVFDSNVKQDAVNLTLAKNCFDPYNGKAVLF